MREPATTARLALHARLTHPDQLAPLQPEGDLPPYLESFLAHLRLLVGVPFEYLVPDDRLLPPESIRFFYLDRSWADRLVDGAAAVGQIGSREEAHYQARAARWRSSSTRASAWSGRCSAARASPTPRPAATPSTRRRTPSRVSRCAPAPSRAGRTWTSAPTTRSSMSPTRRRTRP